MILKFIRCELPLRSRNAFSSSQRKWASISKIPGFLLQFGGFTTVEPNNHAVIIGFWENRRDYKIFMSKYHDEIYNGSGQKQTYNSCKIQVFPVKDVDPIHSNSLFQSLTKGIHVWIHFNKNDIVFRTNEPHPETLKLATEPENEKSVQVGSIPIKIEPTWTVQKG